jgi:hypothetical protein
MKFVEYLKPGALAVRGYAERLVGQVPAESFARIPVVNGATVIINHPAFVLGHLSLYPVQLAEMAGIQVQGTEVPEHYQTLFKMGAQCVDDPQGILYPSKDELVERYFTSTDALIARLADLDEKVFDAPLENPARRETFGTVGAFLAYLLLAHPQTHLGQVSGWRRCMGMGPA